MNRKDLEDKTDDELGSILISKGVRNNETECIKGKENRIKAIMKIEQDEKDGKKSNPNTIEKDKKDIRTSDPNWTSHVLDCLTEDEIKYGYPTVDGLRRITELIYGDILVSHTDILEIPTTKYEKCTACHHIELRRHFDGEIISAKSCVDVRYHQTTAPYNEYLVATACTRAEGKTLRRILKLATVTAEEVQGTEFENEENLIQLKINEGQILGIRKVCERLNINVNKLIKRYGESFDKIENVPHTIAIQILNDCSLYQNNSRPIPKEILNK